MSLLHMYTSKNYYDENGYLVIRNLLSTSELDKIKKDAEEIFLFQIGRHNLGAENFEEALYQLFKVCPQTIINCGKHIQHLISLHKLSLNEKLIDWVKHLGLDFPNITTRPVLFFHNKNLAKEEIFYKIPGHQDFYSMQHSLNSIIIWIPLINVNKDLGTLEVVPKSHKNGLLTTKVQESFGLVETFKDEDYVSLEMSKGDVLFFSSFLVHRSGNNITENIRWSANFRFGDMAEEDFINRNYPHPYIYKSVVN